MGEAAAGRRRRAQGLGHERLKPSPWLRRTRRRPVPSPISSAFGCAATSTSWGATNSRFTPNRSTSSTSRLASTATPAPSCSAPPARSGPSWSPTSPGAGRGWRAPSASPRPTSHRGRAAAAAQAGTRRGRTRAGAGPASGPTRRRSRRHEVAGALPARLRRRRPTSRRAIDYVVDRATRRHQRRDLRRLMLRGRHETGIDLVAPSDLRDDLSAAVARGERCR